MLSAKIAADRHSEVVKQDAEKLRTCMGVGGQKYPEVMRTSIIRPLYGKNDYAEIMESNQGKTNLVKFMVEQWSSFSLFKTVKKCFWQMMTFVSPKKWQLLKITRQWLLKFGFRWANRYSGALIVILRGSRSIQFKLELLLKREIYVIVVHTKMESRKACSATHSLSATG